ncbi:AMP-binding protein [Streptomyces sp. NPDC049837]|uniref:AMP-binding protein n=1 Tax=Streptomyces sp. NPDC049837 TaxID=3155277 RepID=UPI0034418E2B
MSVVSVPVTGHGFRTYVEDILDALDKEPDREALVRGQRSLSGGEVRDLVHRLAWALHDAGLRRGQGVTLLCGNLPEALCARYAAHLLGCRVSHLYNGLSAEAQAAIVRDVDSAALVVDPGSALRAGEITELTSVPRVLSLGPAPLGDDLLAMAEGGPATRFLSRAEPDDICIIRHTGGTTGHPKGICVPFSGMPAITRPGASGAGARMLADPAPRLLVATTLAHGAGALADVALRHQGSVVLLDGFDPAAVWRAIEAERITDLFLLPPLLYQLLDHPDAATADASSLRCVVYGGCTASPNRIGDALKRFGPILMQFYGQSESGSISVLAPEDHDPARPERLRSTGRVVPGVQVAIRDPSGNDLPSGRTGEICVRSASLMQGYWKQPDLTGQVLRDGWLHTGDVGFLDGDGYLTVVDRLKDMVVVVGGHVYTAELEDLLNAHPQVRQSAVFGVRDADGVERVHAVVVPSPGSPVTADELRGLIRARRGPMYEPTRIDFTPALPLTDAGKPDKGQLRLRAAGPGN